MRNQILFFFILVIRINLSAQDQDTVYLPPPYDTTFTNVGEVQNGPGTPFGGICAPLEYVENGVDVTSCWVMNDLTGKIAINRKNGCFFSYHAYFSQLKGAVGCITCHNDPSFPDEIIDMLYADSAQAVVIPHVFMSYNQCRYLDTIIANAPPGNPVKLAMYSLGWIPPEPTAVSSKPNEISLVLFPNPANETINLMFQLEKEEPLEIALVNLLGQRQVLFAGRGDSGDNHFEFPIENRESGWHFIQVIINGQVVSYPVLRQD